MELCCEEIYLVKINISDNGLQAENKQLTWRKESAREIQHGTLQSPFTCIKKFPSGEKVRL